MTNQHNSEIDFNWNDPIGSVASAIKFSIEHGFIKEPSDLLPENLWLNLDCETECCVLIDAVNKALKLLAQKGVIEDSGTKIRYCPNSELEIAWIVSGTALPGKQ